MQDLGRFLIVLGAAAVLIGVLLVLAPRIPWLGRLPGDVLIRRGTFTFYFPLVTCLVVSVILTLILNFFWRRKLWWMTPLVAMLLILGILVIFGQSSAISAFIYTIF